MICVKCSEIVDESSLFIGVYADVGLWEIGEEQDEYSTEISRYLAVLHIECLKDCPVEQLMRSIEQEMAEFRKRVEKQSENQYREKLKPTFKQIGGGKKNTQNA